MMRSLLRRFRRETRDYSDLLEHHVALYRAVPPPVQHDINRFVNGFLRGKTFYGRNGFEVHETHKVIIAATAALVGMRQNVGCFSSVRWILLYPDIAHVDGETFDVSKVILAWDMVAAETAEVIPGCNLVVHEFAHVLDHRLGISHGTAALREAFDRLYEKIERDEPCVLPDDAAESPEEFFPAASEVFFSAPNALRDEFPALYGDLRRIYGLDMASCLST